jgi:hypothetical protein
MTSPSTSRSEGRAAFRRAQRLQATVRWTGRWFIAQGLLYCLMNDWLCQHAGLRWQDLMVPYIRVSGVALLTLGLLVNAGLRSARYQYMAVDGVILCLLAQAYFGLSYCLSGHALAHWEWLALVVNLGLGATLTAFRTRSQEMDAASAGPLLALPVTELARSLKQGRWKEAWSQLTRPRAEDVGPDPGLPGQDGKKSEALPHLE